MAITILQTPPDLSPSGNPICFRVKTTVHGSGDRLSARVLVESPSDPGVFSPLPLLNLYPDVNGLADIDISRLLHDRMSPALPDIASGAIRQAVGNMVRYKIVFSEHPSLSAPTDVESSVYVAIHARLNADQISSIQFYEYIDLCNHYLSLFPACQETTFDGIHYLYFLDRSVFKPYKVKATVITRSGQHRDYTIGSFTTTDRAYSVHIIPVGLRHISFLNDQNDMASYSVWVEDGTGREVGGRVYFTLRSSVCQYEYFLFENAMGGMDTLLSSRLKDTLKVDREEYNLSTNILSRTTDYTNTIESGSGYVSKKITEMFKYMMISNNVFLAAAVLLPILLEKGSFTVIDERSDLYFVNFKYKPANEKDLLNHYETRAVKKVRALLCVGKCQKLTANSKNITAIKNIKL
ncbi:MAG: hypothetical protein RRY39_06625 [Odoribacter sp.]